ncbi:MAG: LysR family transcriptional regulator [Maritimibacter sp.]
MTPMYDLNLLRILVAVVDSGSVTSAAGKLNMSQPTVSQALSRLRDITGDQLFIRDAQRMTPTAHAMRLYNEAVSGGPARQSRHRADGCG